MARRRGLLCLCLLPALGCGMAAGPGRGLEDAVVMLQGTAESMPSSLKDKVKSALGKVDPADIANAFSAFARITSQQAGVRPTQWTLGGGTYSAQPQPLQPAAFSQPMFQQPQPAGFQRVGYAPAAYGQPMLQQQLPAAYGQPMFYQQRAPAYARMAPVQQLQMPTAAPWQMQSGPMAGAGSFYMPGFGQGADAASPMQQAAEAARDAAEAAVAEGIAQVRAVSKRRLRDLAFIHVPSNFGHAIERAALMTQDVNGFYVNQALEETNKDKQQLLLNMAQGPGGEAWGMMSPDLRQISETTGCNLYFTPPSYWPEATARKYFRYNEGQNRTVFGMLRDPYDKIVHEFRVQVLEDNQRESRKAASESEGEGDVDEEGLEYKRYYEECDVNSWVKAELTKVKDGDRFRGNCHLLPQSEYFEGPHGISVPIDNRLIPQSFDEVMRNHGYDIRMNTAFHNYQCDISAWSLDEEAKALVREVYAGDFELVCQRFGYCDQQELTCLKQIPRMCAGSPHAD